MRILLVTQYFYPENFKSNDLAFELANRGHKVDALVGIPNYPDGVYYKGYGIFKKRHEKLNGVNVYRVFQLARGRKASALGLSLNYLSFAFFGTLHVIFHFLFKKKYDAIIVYEPSPITQMIPAIILGKLTSVKVYSWVTDIWPDSVACTLPKGKGKFVLKILDHITEWVYRNSDKILISSLGMKKLVNRNADYSDKIIYYPHWCEDISSMPLEEIPPLPPGFIIMMAGNIGNGIGYEKILDCAEQLLDITDLYFVFVGGGSLYEKMKSDVESRGLFNVIMLGRYPFSKMPAFYKASSALLLTLKATEWPHLDATVPSRLQSYFAAGKPILAMINESAEKMIRDAQCGFVAPAGDYTALANYIRHTVMKDKQSFMLKGEKSRSYFEKYFVLGNCVSNLEAIIQGKSELPFPVPSV